jgi:hypothetical protein
MRTSISTLAQGYKTSSSYKNKQKNRDNLPQKGYETPIAAIWKRQPNKIRPFPPMTQSCFQGLACIDPVSEACNL